LLKISPFGRNDKNGLYSKLYKWTFYEVVNIFILKTQNKKIREVAL